MFSFFGHTNPETAWSLVFPRRGPFAKQKGCVTHMSRVNLLITFASFAAMSILIAFLLTVLLPEPTAPPVDPSSPQVAEEAQPGQALSLSESGSDSAQYLLREYEGKLAVYTMPWQEGDPPQMVLDVALSTLPPYDQGQLKIGVPVRDYQELVQRIEDYIS